MSLDLAFKNTTSDYTGTGAGLAGRLTSAQADNNSWLIKQAVEALQTATGKTIDSISAVGNQLTITYTDATTDVITIPTATWTWRGDFAEVSYAVNDLLSSSGTIYLVLQAHTGVAPFDAGRQIGGNDVYQKILDFPAVPGFTVTDATFTPTLAHANSYIRCTNSTGCVVTLDSSVAYPDWTEIHFRDACATGGVSFAIDSDGSINSQFNCSDQTAGNGSTATLKKVGSTSAWDLMGLLASS
ncbi:MAG TPA: hypothetical protein VFK30_06190 [Anaerolineae bacterium]|nr:hypothetical protein [Anaerolineae bacterium]